MILRKAIFITALFFLLIANSSAGGFIDLHAKATYVAVGSSANGELKPQDDVYYFSFDAIAGEDYTVHIFLGVLPGAYLSLYDTDGTTVLATSGAYSYTTPFIKYRCTSSGKHYIKVKGISIPNSKYDKSDGTYVLSITKDTK